MKLPNKEQSMKRKDLEPGYHKVGDVPYLHLRVRERSDGAKTRHFYLVYRERRAEEHVEGRQVRQSIGQYPDELSLADASEIARQTKRAIRGGKEPPHVVERRANLEAPTFGFVASKWLEEVSSKKTAHRDNVRWLARFALPRWEDRKIKDIRRVEVREALKGVPGDVQRNRVRSLLFSIFRWASRNDLYEGVNPVEGIDKAPEARRSRTLSDDEIRKVWETSNPVLRLILVTAQRPDDVYGMTRGEIKDGDWVIPQERFKLRVEHAVPLSSLALEVLDEIESAGQDAPLFSLKQRRGVWTGEKGKRRFARWMEWLESIGVPDAKPKDLQRTVRTRMPSLGILPDVAERVQGHALRGSRRHYDTWDYLPQKRAALERWADELRRIINKEQAKVVPLGRVKRDGQANRK